MTVVAEWHPDLPSPLECRRRLARCRPREREVLSLLAGGFTRQQAARQLGIVEKTVYRHLDNAYEMLQVRPLGMALALFTRAVEAERLVAVPPVTPAAPESETADETRWYWQVGGRQTPTALYG